MTEPRVSLDNTVHPYGCQCASCMSIVVYASHPREITEEDRALHRDAKRYRFLERMWPIDLLMLLNSHMDGLDDMLVGEAVDAAIAADIPRHK